MGFIVLKNTEGANSKQIVDEVIALVRQDIGAVAAFKQALVVQRLPKTRSGKILRKTLRAIVDGDDYVLPSTIEDPAVLDEIEALL
jgi:propionyl-CoA synthetase